MTEDAKCYTFYSYKGGSGRTTAMLNTVKYLITELGASAERPILLVDADLESAGLTYYFGCQSKFKDELNSGNVFSDISSIFTKDNERVIFGSTDEKNKSIACKDAEVWKTLCRMDEKDTSTKKFSEAFASIVLPSKYFKQLNRIVESELDDSPDYRASNKMSLYSLKDGLVKVDAMDISAAEKVERKSEMLKSFLPTRSFIDVSEYFSPDDSKPLKNVVKFLGTNVSYEDRVQRADAEISINKLVSICSRHNYCAVVFDSGAGTQTSAYVLHSASDVIVYCMRPTTQFIDGTWDNLDRFYNILSSRQIADKKRVILFPNAVPEVLPGSEALRDYSFKEISRLSEIYPDLIDNTFCTYDSCLHEVPLFKWCEKILGCSECGVRSISATDVHNVLKTYSVSTLPENMKKYTDVYQKLAERLAINS